MKSYIAFLRGVNVGGHNKLNMAQLRTVLQRLGLKETATYIQSGNLVFKSGLTSPDSLGKLIAGAILDTFGIDIQVLVMTPLDLQEIVQNCPFNQPEAVSVNRLYYVLPMDIPQNNRLNLLKPEDYKNESFFIGAKCIYLDCTLGAGKAKLTNNVIEQKLKVAATTRNHNTLVKLLGLSKG